MGDLITFTTLIPVKYTDFSCSHENMFSSFRVKISFLSITSVITRICCIVLNPSHGGCMIRGVTLGNGVVGLECLTWTRGRWT